MAPAAARADAAPPGVEAAMNHSWRLAVLTGRSQQNKKEVMRFPHRSFCGSLKLFAEALPAF
jgi:hypothetical protein